MQRPSSLDSFRSYFGKMYSLEDYEQLTGETIQRHELTDEEFNYLMAKEGVYDASSFYAEE